jgi:hypothetical protein
MRGRAQPVAFNLNSSVDRAKNSEYTNDKLPNVMLLPNGQDNRENKIVMTRKRLTLCFSLDKGRTGGVGRGEIRALCMICSAKPPLIPLVRLTVIHISKTYCKQLVIVLTSDLM